MHKPEASYHKGSLYALLLSVVMQSRAVHDTNSSGTLGKLSVLAADGGADLMRDAQQSFYFHFWRLIRDSSPQVKTSLD